MRGRRGTESGDGIACGGREFRAATPGAVDFVPALLTDRGNVYEFRALSKGQSLGDQQDSDFTYGLQTIAPFSPANITGTRANGTGSDLTLAWFRSARLNAEWVNYIDVPLDEPVEIYDAAIMNGSAVMRSFTGLTSPTVTYTAAQQSADWGTVPASFTVNVQQISSRYGPGNVGAAVV